MKLNRSSGIILHPSSLPGTDGIGDIGPDAYHWVDILAEMGCSLWQVLPLGPTGYGDSPYQCFSAFAGNPYLISPSLLLAEGLLTLSDLVDRPVFSDSLIDYGQVIKWKINLLNRAYNNFQRSASAELLRAFSKFQEEEAVWLNDFCLFMAIKDSQGGEAWNKWPQPLRKREKKALLQFALDNNELVQRHALRQFLFFKQWKELHEHAHEKHITIIGDIPIFIAYDSADAWSHPDLFFFDQDGLPTVVAGVPPDYFSPTGQLWGNPLYRWDIHRQDGYAWWVQRMKASLRLFDIIRLDHFRGFAGYWEVPANLLTAEIGRWVPGPGKHFFSTIRESLGDLPIIAEDLGVITPDVEELREAFDLPGMKIFQFAFSTDTTDPFLPHNYPINCIAYTGTHDNDTSRGWYDTAPEIEKDFIRRYIARSGDDISWDMIRAIWSSVAIYALAPIQDFLSLRSESRMNFPGKPGGNWSWRLPPNAINDWLIMRIKEVNYLYNRSQIQSTHEKGKPEGYFTFEITE